MRFNFSKRRYTSAMARSDISPDSALTPEAKGLTGQVQRTPSAKPQGGAAIFNIESLLMRSSSRSYTAYSEDRLTLQLISLAVGEEYTIEGGEAIIYIITGLAEITLSGSSRGRKTTNTVCAAHAITIPRGGNCAVKCVGRGNCTLICVRSED